MDTTTEVEAMQTREVNVFGLYLTVNCIGTTHRPTDYGVSFANSVIAHLHEHGWRNDTAWAHIAGCGSGFSIVALLELFKSAHVIACDQNPHAIESTRRLLKQRNLLHRVELLTSEEVFFSATTTAHVGYTLFNPPQRLVHPRQGQQFFGGKGGSATLCLYLEACLKHLQRGTEVFVPVNSFADREPVLKCIARFARRDIIGEFVYDVTKFVEAWEKFYTCEKMRGTVDFHRRENDGKVSHEADVDVYHLVV